MESHNVETQDGYVLGMFRIPYSPKLENRNSKKRVAFLMHGLISSSDVWLSSGSDNALAYVLSDAGYDVWLGNARGNSYSKEHKSIYFGWLSPSFWSFSWEEIADIDLTAMFHYVLTITGESDLHYVGHSQGTTVYFALLASQPEYNQVIRQGHMLAPVAYMTNIKSPFAILAPLIGSTPTISALIGNYQFIPGGELLALLGSIACYNNTIFQEICSNAIFLLTGFDPGNLNYVSMMCSLLNRLIYKIILLDASTKGDRHTSS